MAAGDDTAPGVESAAGGGWRVMRQDDNGNRFEVTVCASRGEAEAAAQRYEARGHKQLYWVEAC